MRTNGRKGVNSQPVTIPSTAARTLVGMPTAMIPARNAWRPDRSGASSRRLTALFHSNPRWKFVRSPGAQSSKLVKSQLGQFRNHQWGSSGHADGAQSLFERLWLG